MDITGKRVLITGGSGFLGRALAKDLLQKNCDITIFSRSERPQVEMKKDYPNCRYVLGDIKDEKAVYRAMNGQDVVIHAAAMKHVPIAEDQPIECMKTNIMGSINVLEAAKKIDTVQHLVSISTDKAPQPTSVYGFSKLMLEKMTQEIAEEYKDMTFSLVRYGNVLFSSGSVIEIWIKLAKQNKKLKITVPEMTRFFFLVEDAVYAVNESIEISSKYKEKGYHCVNYVPTVRSCVLRDLLEVIMEKFDYNYDQVEIIGNRGNENLHEVLLTPEEHQNAEYLPNAYKGKGVYLLGAGNSGLDKIVYSSEDCEHFSKKEISDILEESGVYENIK